jgi:integrative and conjugative element protein (TIGR02256 family)
MPFLATWEVPGTGQLVYLREQPLQVFNRYKQEGIDSKEAGGILLGHVRGEHLEIIEATEPSFWDRRFRFLFERMPYFHHKLAMKRWKESNGLVRYIGEWHTHPQNHPTPSSIDITEWQVLAADRRDGRPLLALIVGCKGLHLEYMFSNGERCILDPFIPSTMRD